MRSKNCCLGEKLGGCRSWETDFIHGLITPVAKCGGSHFVLCLLSRTRPGVGGAGGGQDGGGSGGWEGAEGGREGGEGGAVCNSWCIWSELFHFKVDVFISSLCRWKNCQDTRAKCYLFYRNIDIISGQRINLFNKNNNLTPVLKLTPFLSWNDNWDLQNQRGWCFIA